MRILPVVFVVLCMGSLSAQERASLHAGWELAPEAAAGTRPNEGWQPARVPATFEDHLGADFDGVCWYRTRITRPEHSDGARFRLVFHGAATEAQVFADGEAVGGHLGAWTPWSVDVTAALADGAALIEVRLDEKVGHNTQGFLPIIQPHFGGLWRSVELCIDRGPVLDEDNLFLFGELGDAAAAGAATLQYEYNSLPHQGSFERIVRIEVLEGGASLAMRERPFRTQSPGLVSTMKQGRVDISVPVRPWTPADPFLYTVRISMVDPSTDATVQVIERKVGFRRLEANGTTVLWNGQPLQLRGMLHWGYSAPHFAPPEDKEYWRPQLEAIKAMGCNMVKACLWMPPRSFHELADELGLIVWQEYPTWHPTLTEEFLPELKQEYEEFHRFDRNHASVAIRSLTCETGHSAELAVLQALYDRCKELVPQTLVVDDSAWIEWHRVHDFYDDHPYGNNSWWPGKLRQMNEHIAARTAMPLLLGECMAADTWMDLEAWDAAGYADDLWWSPWGLGPQRDFEALVERRFGRAIRESLRPVSLAYALRNRKYQVERLRLSSPDAGYTLSVVRDFTKARMGHFDDFGQMKWPAEDWSWHRDTLLALDTEGDRRGFVPGRTSLPVRVSHFGAGKLGGDLALTANDGADQNAWLFSQEPGTVSESFPLVADLPEVEIPQRFRMEARLNGSHQATNHWNLWVHPRPTGELDPSVRIVEALDRDTITYLREGGRVLLRASDRKGSLKTAGIWFLKGAPWAPPHPLNGQLPADFLLELQSFDLEVGRVIHGEAWIEHVDPLLAFWDTHDIAHVNPWLLAFTAQVGKGRLGVTVLNHDTPAGQLVLERMVDYLAHGPAPTGVVPEELVERLAQAVDAEMLSLKDWNIALDPEDLGQAAGWKDGGSHDGADWKPIEAGAHWESQGFDQYTGVAWYRISVDVPAHWDGRPVTAVFEGVDDSYYAYLDSQEVARHGDPETGETVWLIRTTADLTPHLKPGTTQTLVLRVVDHQGAGGLHRPVFLTTGPVGPESDLVH